MNEGLNLDHEPNFPWCGFVDSRGMAGVTILRDKGYRSGYFMHNNHRITVYSDSTERELAYFYALRVAEARR